MADKIAIGMPTYGRQEPQLWVPIVQHVNNFAKQNIELINFLDASGMAADYARNSIVKRFLDTDAEWLMWIDADNVLPIGSIRRLIDTGKDLVTGIYVRRTDAEPIAYYRLPDGAYESVGKWRRGEILPIDAAGMGALLSHRSVYEDIRKEYRVLSRLSGGTALVHKDNIVGDIFDNATDDNDGKVVDGVLRERVHITSGKFDFPYFSLEHGRTEDYWFYEKAKGVGHSLWLDTSVEVGHIFSGQKTPAHFRERLRAK